MTLRLYTPYTNTPTVIPTKRFRPYFYLQVETWHNIPPSTENQCLSCLYTSPYQIEHQTRLVNHYTNLIECSPLSTPPAKHYIIFHFYRNDQMELRTITTCATHLHRPGRKGQSYSIQPHAQFYVPTSIYNALQPSRYFHFTLKWPNLAQIIALNERLKTVETIL